MGKEVETLSQFYRYAIFVLFAVVLGASFPISTKVIIPLSNLPTVDGIENLLALILVYFFIISSWIAYFISITLNPHTESKLGIGRFVVDLFIIFVYYFLVIQIPDKSQHRYIFVGMIPIIFGAFLTWDILRYFEYKKVKKETKQAHADRKKRLFDTVITFIIFLVIAYFYNNVIPIDKIIYDKYSVGNIVFIIITLIVVCFYRKNMVNKKMHRHVVSKSSY